MPRKSKPITDMESYVKKLNARLRTLEEEQRTELRKFQTRIQSIANNTTAILSIYSANNLEICIGSNHKDWHRIVCQYEGSICKGGPRPHWQSRWLVRENGFSLESMLDMHWRGWHGQYTKSELRYDELPRDILQLHHNKLVEHIKNLAIWYPCHIYNDFTGDLYRP